MRICTVAFDCFAVDVFFGEYFGEYRLDGRRREAGADFGVVQDFEARDDAVAASECGACG